ncbi:MAG: MmcQ/YjbR family DNA-binding protein [Taibaiella sp.]|nr:MmcQ/YjbR family DNA-binding protein [Taibaiella sp.]
MDLEDIRRYCLSKAAATEEIKFEHLLCFCVLGKIFFAISLDEQPLSGTGKVGQEAFELWMDRPDFMQAPYFAKRQWVTCTNLNRLAEREGKEFIDLSYQLVTSRFPKKTRQEYNW